MKKNHKRVLATGLVCAMAVTGMFSGGLSDSIGISDSVYAASEDNALGEVFGAVTDDGVEILSENAKRIASLHNPISDEVNETIDYSYVYFGEYPQSLITGDALTAEVTGATFDANGDAVVDSKKYNRVETESGTYGYYLYEPIRWRVICKEGNEVLLRSDLALDCKVYDKIGGNCWEYSELRIWLNGEFGAKDSFLKKAFTNGELNAIHEKKHEDVYEYYYRDGRTQDKVYMLSDSQLSKLGGIDKPYELITEASDYAMREELLVSATGGACWWIRNEGSPISYEDDYAEYVNETGMICNGLPESDNQNKEVASKNRTDIGVCPAIVLNLNNADVWCTEEEYLNGRQIDRKSDESYLEFGYLTDTIYYYVQDHVLYICGSGKLDQSRCILEYDDYRVNSPVEEVIVEGSITEIGNGLFQCNDSIKKITLMDGVESIGDSVFDGSINLEEINIPVSVNKIGQNAFHNTKVLDDVRNKNQMFVINDILADMNGCTGIVTIPDNVKIIKDNVLEDASGLLKVVIPKSVEVMEEGCFSKADFAADIYKFFVEEGSVAEEYFKTTFGSGYYVIKADGTTQRVLEEATVPVQSDKPVLSEEPIKSETPVISEEPTKSESPVLSEEPTKSENPLISTEPATSAAIIAGDVNLDKKVELTDAQLVLKAALKIETLTEDGKIQAADVDKDEKITLADAQMTLKIALKIITVDKVNAHIKSTSEEVQKAKQIELPYTAEEIAKKVEDKNKWQPFVTDVTDKEPAGSSSTVKIEKSAIYLYPEETTEVAVELDLDGKFTFAWPSYCDNWKVIAQPDGKLTDSFNGNNLDYLFWKGESDIQCSFEEGFCVKGEDTVEFLMEALKAQGLTMPECIDFITFWLVEMANNEYNVISFVENEYTDNAKLSFDKEPDSVQRVFMVWYGSDEAIEIKEQQLNGFERKGFTVVEWGGAEVSPSNNKK